MRCSCGKFIKFAYTKEGEEYKSLYEHALDFLMDETNDGCCRESAKEFIIHYIDYLFDDYPRFYGGAIWDLVPKEEIKTKYAEEIQSGNIRYKKPSGVEKDVV